MPRLGDTAVAQLRSLVRGHVSMPQDPEYEARRRVWNGAIDRRPAVIVGCRGTADVAAAVTFARDHGLPIAVRGGGHHVAGFGSCDDGMVVDLSPLKGVRVDARARTVRAQGGVLWGELDRETQAFGLATTGGLVSTTGIGGFTLGGGIGWLMRRHGLAADNLVSADVVLSDGSVVTADRRSAPDLLWGLRGGGGNFGVVTSFEFDVHPVGPMVYGGVIFFPVEAARGLLRFFRDWTRDLSPELTTMLVFLTGPPEPFLPEEYQGVPLVGVAACHLGDQAVAEEDLRPLRDLAEPVADVLGPIPYTVLQSLFDESAPAGLGTYWKSEYLAEVDDEGLDRLVDQAAALSGLFPLSVVHLHHVEGAVSEEPAGGSAFAHRDIRFVLNIIGVWDRPEMAGSHIDWVRGAWQAMQPHGTGRPYVNFLGPDEPDRVRAAYGAATYERLAQLKGRYDPDNVLRINHNILPA